MIIDNHGWNVVFENFLDAGFISANRCPSSDDGEMPIAVMDRVDKDIVGVGVVLSCFCPAVSRMSRRWGSTVRWVPDEE
jgi:hypothetical protein